MKYTEALMEDLIRWYGLEGHPEFQLVQFHDAAWAASVANVSYKRMMNRIRRLP